MSKKSPGARSLQRLVSLLRPNGFHDDLIEDLYDIATGSMESRIIDMAGGIVYEYAVHSKHTGRMLGYYSYGNFDKDLHYRGTRRKKANDEAERTAIAEAASQLEV